MTLASYSFRRTGRPSWQPRIRSAVSSGGRHFIFDFRDGERSSVSVTERAHCTARKLPHMQLVCSALARASDIARFESGQTKRGCLFPCGGQPFLFCEAL